MGSQAAVARPARGAGSQLATGVLLPAIAAAIALASARVALPAGHSALNVVGICLLLTWAVATAITTRTAAAALRWPLAGGVLAGAVALTASRTAGQLSPASQHRLAADVAALAVTLVIAASCHVLLAFPDGRLRGPAARAGIAAAYLVAAGAGLVLALTGTPVPATATVLAWAAVLAGAMPVARRKYARAGARDRERLQWLAIGLVLAADVALFGLVLHGRQPPARPARRPGTGARTGDVRLQPGCLRCVPDRRARVRAAARSETVRAAAIAALFLPCAMSRPGCPRRSRSAASGYR